jgi:AraC family transcriptional regulator
VLSIFGDSFRDAISSQALLGSEIALAAQFDGKPGSLVVSIRRFDEIPSLPAKRRIRKLTTAEMQKVQDEIRNVISTGIRLPAIAATVALSPGQFSRAFHATMGETFSAYVLRVRLEVAMRLLSEADDPLCEVAIESGFGDQSSFSRAFAKAAGISPFRWRLLAKNKNRAADAIEPASFTC